MIQAGCRIEDTGCRNETKVHLEMLYETESLEKDIFERFFHRYEELGAKLYNFREAVIKSHRVS